MDPSYLAQSNGSAESAGRGSGLDEALTGDGTRKKVTLRTPYMNMTFAPLERRLDSAIFRALFASSIRQARQFCVHGFVKVNGKKMIYPSYALNPGDMFQVEPDRVLFATGAPKGSLERRETKRYKKTLAPAEDSEEGKKEEATPEVEEATEPMSEEDAKATLKTLMSKTKNLLESEKDSASATRKRELRELQRLVRKTISQTPKNQAPTLTGAASDQMEALMQKLGIQEEAAAEPGATEPQPDNDSDTKRSMSPKQKRELERVLAELAENPIDASKPYATPWRPREYMSAFAFVPRYLEVHHKVCSAVYLRHPVARPGLAEVPTPFDLGTSSLAFNWYLRRR